MRTNLIIVTLGVSLLATSCATKSGTGTAVGAGAGSLVGYAVGGTSGLIIGGLLGGVAGYGVGKHMEKDDQRRAELALERNRSEYWRNQSNGHTYRVTPTRTRTIDGRRCRDFKVHAEIDGKPDNVSGTACRRSDGSWESIST